MVADTHARPPGRRSTALQRVHRNTGARADHTAPQRRLECDTRGARQRVALRSRNPHVSPASHARWRTRLPPFRPSGPHRVDRHGVHRTPRARLRHCDRDRSSIFTSGRTRRALVVERVLPVVAARGHRLGTASVGDRTRSSGHPTTARWRLVVALCATRRVGWSTEAAQCTSSMVRRHAASLWHIRAMPSHQRFCRAVVQPRSRRSGPFRSVPLAIR